MKHVYDIVEFEGQELRVPVLMLYAKTHGIPSQYTLHDIAREMCNAIRDIER